MYYGEHLGYPSLFYYNTGVSKMNINGRGSIMAQPDIAVVNLGVQTENKELKIAQNENAIKSTQVINTLIRMGIPQKDIKTESYTINPQYDYIEGKQVFRGYRVSHIFKVTIRNVEQTGTIVDAAVASGANIVNNINFTLSKPELYYNQALKLALNDAIDKATSIEESLDVVVNKTPICITEESEGELPIVEKAFLASPTATTPISGGQIQISASVKAVFVYRMR